MKRIIATAFAIGLVSGAAWSQCPCGTANCHDADYDGSEAGADAFISVERVAGVAVIGVGGKISGDYLAKKASGAASVFHVRDFPGVGQWCTKWPSPYLVGAVAIDSYILPKVSACGYTESSLFTNTDFNSPPRLRNYVNYLAPMPYTHPPVYAGATLNVGGQRAGAVYEPEVKLESVNLEN